MTTRKVCGIRMPPKGGSGLSKTITFDKNSQPREKTQGRNHDLNRVREAGEKGARLIKRGTTTREYALY